MKQNIDLLFFLLALICFHTQEVFIYVHYYDIITIIYYAIRLNNNYVILCITTDITKDGSTKMKSVVKHWLTFNMKIVVLMVVAVAVVTLYDFFFIFIGYSYLLKEVLLLSHL